MAMWRRARDVTILLALAAVCVAGAAGDALAERCKYKRDGTGNCLSPAFYKCLRDWKKCNDRCKTAPEPAKCNDRCDTKYSAECGD